MSANNSKFIKQIDFDFVFDFGKYSEYTAREVLDEDPGYIVWLHDETEHEVNEKLFEEAEAELFIREKR